MPYVQYCLAPSTVRIMNVDIETTHKLAVVTHIYIKNNIDLEPRIQM
jgi:hypothetical protein